MNDAKKGSRTLLWSMIMSAPGPLVVGLGLLSGRSATQLADFFRRSSELLAIIMSFLAYRITSRISPEDEARRRRIERLCNLFVGAMMCLGGSIMLVLAFATRNSDKGNVIPGLAIAVMGVIANTIFWRRYTRLNRQSPNPILAVQARLYRAKSLVDLCVTAALLSVLLAPGTPFSDGLDLVGSVIVAVYLIFCGVRTVLERAK